MRNYYQRPGVPAIKLHTVNVVEMANGEMQSVRSFSDSPQGNKQAEKLFKRLVKEHEVNDPEDTLSTEQYIADYIEEGTYEDNNGYQLFLTHSV